MGIRGLIASVLVLLSGSYTASADSAYSFIVQIGTVLHETNDNWDFSALPNGDLVGILKRGGSKGKTEVHIIEAASGYQNYKVNLATSLHETGENWDFAVLPNADLVAILKSGSPHDKTEVHIFEANTGYKTVRNYVTGLEETGDNWDFAVLPDADLVAIKKSGTTNSETEVHIYEADTGYKTARVQLSTALGETGDNWDFSVLPNEDLVAIKKRITGSNSTEVHILTASDGYRSFNLHTGTALHEIGDDFEVAVASDKDVLLAIKKYGTGTGKTEVHAIAYRATQANASITGGVDHTVFVPSNGGLEYRRKIAHFGIEPYLDGGCSKWAILWEDNLWIKGAKVCLSPNVNFKQHLFFLVARGPNVDAALQEVLRKAVNACVIRALAVGLATPSLEPASRIGLATVACTEAFISTMKVSLEEDVASKFSLSIEHVVE